MALAGCMAIDVADIVIKGRHDLKSLEARLVGQRRDEPPRHFVSFTLHFALTGSVPDARRRARDSAVARQVLLGVALAAPGHRSPHELRGRPCSVRSISTGCAASPSIIMVGAHVTDAWTRVEDRSRTLYMVTVFIAGMAAPLFLFLAGLTIAMAASSRAAKVGHAEAAAHGAQARPADLRARLSVPPAIAAAWLGRAHQLPEGRHPQRDGHRDDRRGDPLGPVRRIASSGSSSSRSRRSRWRWRRRSFARPACCAALPDAIEAYIRPLPGRTNFALFPWAAFVLAGAHRRRAGVRGAERIAGAAPSGRPADRRPGRHRRRATRRRFVRRSIRSRTSGPARRRSSSSASASARRWCRSLSASITFTRSCAGASRLAPAPPTCPAASSRPLADRRCSSTGFTSRWRTAASRCRSSARCRSSCRSSPPSRCARCSTQIVKWKDRKMAGRELTGAWRIFAPVLK